MKTGALSDFPPQLFVFDDAVWDSLSVDEVLATWEGMLEMGLVDPPYAAFDIQMDADVFMGLQYKLENYLNKQMSTFTNKPFKEACRFQTSGPLKVDVTISYVTVDGSTTACLRASNKHQTLTLAIDRFTANELKDKILSSGLVFMTVLVLLAARNTVKTVKHNKLAKLGIGKNPHVYTTTISLGRITETEGGAVGEGVSRRPHLRRGHVRNQHYGPRLELVKKVFIQPVFVNADPEWLSKRTAYRIFR